MDLGILNTIIAMVIVLLVLSLLVQALQTLLKKLLKLKSHQFEDSLKDLYDQAIASATPPAQAAATIPNTGATSAPSSVVGKIIEKLKTLARLTIVGNPDPCSPAATAFTKNVLNEFKKIGRVTKFGNPVLDSLSKEDLLKIMAKFESEKFFPDYKEKFKALCDQITGLRDAIVGLTSNDALRGAASSKVAEIRTILAPIFNDVDAIFEGGAVKPGVIFADLLRLNKLDTRGVLKLLDEAQQAITDEKKAAVQASNNAELARLETLSSELTSIANKIGNLSQEFDKAVSPLSNKLAQVEIWFDTVTQSFDERYVRHMKAVAIYISIVVVVVLNANFFRIYRSLSTNEIQRDLIVASGPEVLERARKANEAEPTPSQSPATTSTPSPTPPQTAVSNASSTPNASPSPSPINAKAEIEKSRREINTLSSDYQAFGFSPLSGQQVWSWLQSLGVWTALERNNQGKLGNGWGFTLARNFEGVVVNKENKPIPVDCKERDKDGRQIFTKGYCTPDWRVQTGSEWWESRKSDVVTLLGWGVMVMLLSVGAPFWQDTLESLFGIKQLLRTKTGTQNVETPSGSGQPKE
ncbi:MAG TPA: hypothetical protein VJ306_20530 [Pyrinomonadaceae bacterium]|jgi:cell division septation protein DedD|nr:hypothetical protein [Pyrinomonadaceae bacterium]